MLPGAQPDPDALPVYGEASDQPGAPGPDVEVVAGPSHRPGGLVAIIAIGSAIALVVAATAVRLLLGDDPARVEVLESHEVVDLPAGVTSEPAVAWRATLDAAQLLPMGGIVVVSEEGVGAPVRALDLADGEERWRVRIGPPREQVRWISATGDGQVLVAYGPVTRRSRLRIAVIDVGDGTVRWRSSRPGAEFSASWGDRVAVFSRQGSADEYDLTLLASDDGAVRGRAAGQPVGFGAEALYLLRDEKLVAVDRRTGDERWTRDAGSYTAVTEVGSTEVEGTLVVGRSNRALVGLSAEEGTFLWGRSFGHPVWAARSLGRVIVVLSDERTYGLDPLDGSVRWEMGTRVWRFASLVRLQGRDDVHLLNERVSRMDPATGRSLARSAAPDDQRSVPDVELADGLIYTAWGDDEVRAIDPVTLEPRWSIDVGREVVDLAAAEGTVLVATGDELVGYR